MQTLLLPNTFAKTESFHIWGFYCKNWPYMSTCAAMLSVFTSCFKITCNAICFSRKRYDIWFLLHFVIYFNILFMEAYLPIHLTVQHNLRFLCQFLRVFRSLTSLNVQVTLVNPTTWLKLLGNWFSPSVSIVLRPGPKDWTGTLGFWRPSSSPLSSTHLFQVRSLWGSSWRLPQGPHDLLDHGLRTWIFRIPSPRTTFYFQGLRRLLPWSVLKRTFVSLVCAPLGARNDWRGSYLGV